jgi:hypothetical protein
LGQQIERHEKSKKKARVKRLLPLPVLFFANSYPATMASAGQLGTQAPQSVHFSASIMCLPSFSIIASVGQSLTQAPQLTQESSLIL